MNPFQKIHDALWDLLESSPTFCKLIPVGNRIKLVGENNNPDKEEISNADTPEIRIVSTAMIPTIALTSTSCSCRRRFELQIGSGERTFSKLFELEWAIYVAMMGWSQVFQEIEINGTPIQWKVHPPANMTVNEGIAERDINRGITQWTALWVLEIELIFDRKQLTTIN